MQFSEMEDAVRHAQETLRLADLFLLKMARMLVGRLRKCGDDKYDRSVLVYLKRELQDFNSTTRQWRE